MTFHTGDELVNVGSGMDVAVRELAELIRRIAGHSGRLAFDPSRPDGTPRKLMDNSMTTAIGWRPKTSLEDGIASVYENFRRNQE